MTSDWDGDLARRKRLRLPAYDYTGSGPYFVTTCTHGRRCIFGTIANGETQLNALGKIAALCWLDLPSHYPGTILDEFVVMPNHLHAILLLGQDGGATHALPEVIRGFKTFSARRINETRSTGGAPVWQRGYHERVIRNEDSLAEIRKYVVSNPATWDLDDENPERRNRPTS